MNYRLLLCLCCLFVFPEALCQIRKGEINYVPNQETAIKVAEAIWLPIYGNGINNKKPFVAKLIGDTVWSVSGHLPRGTHGGVPYIEIRKKDCKILMVTHGK